MTHIAINGLSFCGSTIISYILGSLNNCGSIGESHWLIDRTPEGRLLACSRCRKACAVLTPQFRERLRNAGEHWYPIIRRELGVQILISSDKDNQLLSRFDPDGSRSELVLFKSPLAHLQSYARALERTGETPAIDWFPKGWAHHYGEAPAIRGERAFLFLDDFQQNPIGTIKSLASWMGVAFSEDVLEYGRFPHHYLGGNFNPFLNKNKARRPIGWTSKHTETADEGYLQMAISASEAPKVFEKLMLDERRITPVVV